MSKRTLEPCSCSQKKRKVEASKIETTINEIVTNDIALHPSFAKYGLDWNAWEKELEKFAKAVGEEDYNNYPLLLAFFILQHNNNRRVGGKEAQILLQRIYFKQMNCEKLGKEVKKYLYRDNIPSKLKCVINHLILQSIIHTTGTDHPWVLLDDGGYRVKYDHLDAMDFNCNRDDRPPKDCQCRLSTSGTLDLRK